MRTWDVFVVGVSLGVLYLAIFRQARSDNDIVQDLMTSLEDAVKDVANSATENYDKTCGLQDTCRSEQNCSKRECFPLHGAESECVYVYNFTRCNAYDGSQCNRISADFNRSTVRLPSNASISFSDAKALEAAFAPTVCTQRALDATFKSLAPKFSFSKESFFYNIFFATADGAMRFYPARDIRSFRCNTLEPRIRTWYIHSTSVRKDVVVVLDTGAIMTRTYFLSDKTSLDTAKHLTRTLAQNLSADDTLTLISVNSDGPIMLSRLFKMSDDADQTANILTRLLGGPALNGTNLKPLNDNPSKFKAAFEMANSTSGAALKVIVFFTDSGGGNVPPPDLVNATLAPMRAAGAGVFVYDLSSRNGASPWDDALCSRSTDSSESGDPAEQNPLLFLNEYYSFLVRARTAANNGSLAFWTKPYSSASDLGLIMTVSFPAMSSDNTVLLGVAGVDVQTGGLTPQLVNDIDVLLRSDAYFQKVTIPTIVTFNDSLTTCPAVYPKSCNGIQRETLQPFCYSSTEPASDAELQTLICCSGKGCSAGHHGGFPLWILAIVIPVLGLFLVACAGGRIVYKNIRRFNKSPEPKIVPLLIPWEELNLATNQFAAGNVIGRGAFGVVYSGVLRDHKVAVKRLLQTPEKSSDFQRELTVNITISKHPHLVELLGACFRGYDCYLVYELVEGGDLNRWLWPEREEEHAREENGTVLFLTWKRRKQIAHGIAKGLHYLHRGLLPEFQIFHLDLKPLNILLDKGSFTAKIADFGVSQLYEPGQTFKIASVKAGTVGYMAPEILPGCNLPTTKMDVYSFGVVLMQLISGCKLGEFGPSCHRWARRLVEEDAMEKLIDKHLLKTVQPDFRCNLVENCRTLIDIAIRCTQKEPDERPEMEEILTEMDNFQEVQELQELDIPSLTEMDNFQEVQELDTDTK